MNRAKESKKVIRAKAKTTKVPEKQALGQVKKVDPAKTTTSTCRDCKSHSNNPSYCKKHKKHVGKKQNQCEDFS